MMLGSTMLPFALAQGGRFLAGKTLADTMGSAPQIGNIMPSPQRTLGDLMPSDAPGQMAPPVKQGSPQTLGDLSAELPAPMLASADIGKGVTLGDIAQRDLKFKKPNNTGDIIRTILGAISDGFLVYGGQQPVFAPAQARLREKEFDRQRWAEELEAKRREPKSVGGSLVQLGQDGQYKTLYDAPQAFEKYASALGYQPGTPEYQAAVQDYRLGSWSDPAMEAKRTLEGIRYGYRDDLQDQRLDVTRRGQDLTHQDRQASIAQSNTNSVRSNATSRGNAQLRADTQRGAASYRGGSKTGDTIPDGTIIRNPSTGQRMRRQGGQWVPIS